MWEAIRDYFSPYFYTIINSMLEDFWWFSMDEGTDVDVFEELIKRETKNYFNSKATPPYRSYYEIPKSWIILMDIETIIIVALRPSLEMTPSSLSLMLSILSAPIRLTKSEATPDQVLAFGHEDNKFDSLSLPSRIKTCAHCKRKGHIREYCFI